MKKYLCLLTLVMICLFAKAGDKGWQKIENSFYSLELPAHWKPQEGMPGDGTKPGTRDARGFHLYYFAWQTPVKTKEEMSDCMGIDIQTYEKIDKTPVSVREIEKAVIIPPFVSRKEITLPSGGLRIVVLKDSKEMDGSTVRYHKCYLLKKAGIGVHCVAISFREDLIKRKPDTEKDVKRILDSFTVKKIIK